MASGRTCGEQRGSFCEGLGGYIKYVSSGAESVGTLVHGGGPIHPLARDHGTNRVHKTT